MTVTEAAALWSLWSAAMLALIIYDLRSLR